VCEHTGGPQPTYRLEHGTLKIMAEFPVLKGEDAEEMVGMDNMERKQVRNWCHHQKRWLCRQARHKLYDLKATNYR
jgi:hypothetical protein